MSKASSYIVRCCLLFGVSPRCCLFSGCPWPAARRVHVVLPDYSGSCRPVCALLELDGGHGHRLKFVIYTNSMAREEQQPASCIRIR